MTELTFRSSVNASPEQAWQWISSVRGIQAEMAPYLRMTFPAGIRGLGDLTIVPGKPLFLSVLLLGGVLPIDYSMLTLLELTPGVGFLEQSPMGSMRLWRHERLIESASSGCEVVDRLTFEPRFFSRFMTWFVRHFFAHRHAVLCRHLGGHLRL